MCLYTMYMYMYLEIWYFDVAITLIFTLFVHAGSVRCNEHDLPTSFADFLFFMTGCKKPPLTGWQQAPHIFFKHTCYDHLLTMANQVCHCFPVATTCSMMLTLPMHFVDYEAFKDCICVAIHSAKGFGQV